MRVLYITMTHTNKLIVECGACYYKKLYFDAGVSFISSVKMHAPFLTDGRVQVLAGSRAF